MPEHTQAKATLPPASAHQESQSQGDILPQATTHRVLADPNRLMPTDVLYLQRSMGNRAVSQLLGRDRTNRVAGSTSSSVSNVVQRAPGDDKRGYENQSMLDQLNQPQTNENHSILDQPNLPETNENKYMNQEIVGQGDLPQINLPQTNQAQHNNQDSLGQSSKYQPTMAQNGPTTQTGNEVDTKTKQKKGGVGGFLTKNLLNPLAGAKKSIGSMLPSGQTKYNQIHVGKAYANEDKDSLEFAMDAMFGTTTLAQALQEQGDAGVREKLLEMGWKDTDVDKLMEQKSVKVEYLKDKEEREQYRLHISGTITQGKGKVPWDTSEMFANGVGKGNGIFVMDANGTFFGAQHKIALFHHSSFMAGGGVATAGTMQVGNGKLHQLTNKTGHYKAGKEQLLMAVSQLKKKGVSPGSYSVKMIDGRRPLKDVGTGQTLLDAKGT